MERGEELWNKIITVYSPGEGTGKSEIAGSLAYLIAARGKKVWLLDANLFSPSQDILCRVECDHSCTLTEFLVNHNLSSVPWSDISHIVRSRTPGKLYLTSSDRSDTTQRSRLNEHVEERTEQYDKIPASIHKRLKEVDYLIIDTHPSFELINSIWLGITPLLLVVSRISDVDIANLRLHLRDENVVDIQKKLIIFNNVFVDAEGNPGKEFNNDRMLSRFSKIEQNPSILTQTDEWDARSPFEIFEYPIPYSEKLAVYPGPRGMYIQKYKLAKFSMIMQLLTYKVMEEGRGYSR